MAKNQGPNIFTFMNQIFYKKNNVEFDKKACNEYLLSLWLSHDNNLIDIVQEINRLQFVVKSGIIYKYYFDKVPKGKRFIKWTKKEVSKKKEKAIEKIMEETNFSKYEAERHLRFVERLERRKV